MDFLKVKKVKSGRREEHVSEVMKTDISRLNIGGFRDVDKVHATVRRQEKRRSVPFGMVTKKLRLGEMGKVERAYKACRDASLRVIPTYRFDQDQNRILMTNLNRNGMVAISCNNISSDAPKELNIKTWIRPREFLDDFFQHALRAAKKGIYLDHDTYFFLVPQAEHSEAEFDFTLGDFENVKKSRSFTKTPVDRELLAKGNLREAKEAIRAFVSSHLSESPEKSDAFLHIARKYHQYLDIISAERR